MPLSVCHFPYAGPSRLLLEVTGSDNIASSGLGGLPDWALGHWTPVRRVSGRAFSSSWKQCCGAWPAKPPPIIFTSWSCCQAVGVHGLWAYHWAQPCIPLVACYSPSGRCWYLNFDMIVGIGHWQLSGSFRECLLVCPCRSNLIIDWGLHPLRFTIEIVLEHKSTYVHCVANTLCHQRNSAENLVLHIATVYNHKVARGTFFLFYYYYGYYYYYIMWSNLLFPFCGTQII